MGSMLWKNQPVTDACFVADGFAEESGIAELSPEMSEVDAQVVRLVGGFGAPDGVEQMGMGEHAAGVAGELGEKRELDGGERHEVVRHGCFVRR